MTTREGSIERIARFTAKYRVEQESGCWTWTGAMTGSGYGAFRWGDRIDAHRFAYLHYVGPIPAGMVIDHLCRNRGCVNPAHLEVVGQRENVLRGIGGPAANAVKTHCHRGHEFTAANTAVLLNHGRAMRRCRTCARDDKRARRAAR